MPTKPMPAAKDLKICFAHAAYQLGLRFDLRNTGLAYFEVKSVQDLLARANEADVVVVSGFWRNEILDHAPRLKFVQSISAGINQYDQARFRAADVRLASAQGANEIAVSEHAMAMMLSLKRLLHTGRDNQARQHWRGMISEIGGREDESAGKTMLIVGYGRIGQRVARLAKAFDMRVIGVRRNPAGEAGTADAVHSIQDLHALLPEADVVVLTCPLTPETTRLIDATAFAAMKPSAVLINVARGAVVDEPALIEALETKRIAAAGIDVTVEEPLPAASPLWRFQNALITPHTAGETRAYEDNVIDLLLENLDRLARDSAAPLRNGIV